MLLSAFAPWAITPILMAGGAFLCFEASEKILETLTGHHAQAEDATPVDARQLEERQVSGAIRTDLILSAEIMAIALSELPDLSIGTQAIALALVGIAITVGVYGVVAAIVKMDDIGLHLARRDNATAQSVGRGLVKAMPVVLRVLAIVGTAAMVWVGGGIIVHGMEEFGLTTLPHLIHGTAHHAGEVLPVGGAVAEWLVGAIGSAIVGLAIGAVIVGVLHLIPSKKAH